ncbi:MAG: DUF1015 domain-containing protein [Pyrinomonadaceae bacterium]|nr:DUF1015 domain-containing protein [Pyrinomonadaceae bacterium]
MAKIRPFRALRPIEEHANEISCVPYDVVYESEVREFIQDNPLSFLHVTRAEAEFPEDSEPGVDEVFAKAKENLEQFIKKEYLVRDDEPSIYVYRLSHEEHTQTGVVAVCSIDDYEADIIKKHEKTRPDKVEDRTRHMLALDAQTGLIFLAFRNTDTIRDLIARTAATKPLYNFHCDDGIQQTVWRDPDTERWVEAFDDVPALYIADGHHRAESSALTRNNKRDNNPDHTGDEDYNYVLTGMYPAEDLKILAYNRVVQDLNGLSKEEFFEKVQESFVITSYGMKVPEHHNEVCVYIDGEWTTLRFAVDFLIEPDPIERLDVSILQDYLLSPILGIGDARTDKRIGFVGGARGTDELERVVDAGQAQLAFSLYPTTMDDLFAVSDMGEIMPPKSTWFEPKLKDGLLVFEI